MDPGQRIRADAYCLLYGSGAVLRLQYRRDHLYMAKEKASVQANLIYAVFPAYDLDGRLSGQTSFADGHGTDTALLYLRADRIFTHCAADGVVSCE